MNCTNKQQETCDVEKRTCKGCYYNEKTADEMFKELGYKKTYNESYNATHYKHYYYEEEFIFYEEQENIGTNYVESISVEELQAINKKVQELGWKG